VRLQERRQYLRNLLADAQEPVPRPSRKSASGPPLKLVAGYTVLVVDTNILLSSLSLFASLVEAHRWTIVVPVPVIMELDGLSSRPAPLGETAAAAVEYIAGALRPHGVSLKVQTSKGNYLRTLAVRAEHVDFAADGGAGWERSMDDLILRAAVWQDEHWADRSGLLGAEGADASGAAKVVLLTIDRNRECSVARACQGPDANRMCSSAQGAGEATAGCERARPRDGARGRDVSGGGRAGRAVQGAPSKSPCARTRARRAEASGPHVLGQPSRECAGRVSCTRSEALGRGVRQRR
jgi:hypothetical protein